MRTVTCADWKRCVLTLIASLAILVPVASGHARALPGTDKAGSRLPHNVRPAAGFPSYETRLHTAGEVWLAITNYGLIGTEGSARGQRKDLDPLRISYTPSFEWPAGTRNDYLYAGGMWIGGIVGSDTLVSLTINGLSNSAPAEWAGLDTLVESSILRGSRYFNAKAYAEQEYWGLITDTVPGGTSDEPDRRHRPLGLEVSQTSYAWSDRFSRQFVIVELWIRNIGSRPISKVAAGVYMDADVLNENTQVGEGFNDDVSGFLSGAPSLAVPGIRDSLSVAWVADNDGEPIGGTFPVYSPRGVVGIRILRAFPHERFSFNWWLIGGSSSAQDWGPHKAGARTSGTGGRLGAPDGDRNRYYVMTNGEVDYGQLLATQNFTADGWRPPLPPSAACDIADGLDTRQITSVGPSCEPLFPGDSIPFVYAIIGGNNFHTNPNLRFDCNNPYAYLNTIGFEDLVFASTWAAWIYDTPGLDSDGDDYRGEYHLYNCDSVVFGIGYGCDTAFYTGDLGPTPGPHLEPCKVYPPPHGMEQTRPDKAGPAGPACPQAGGDMFVETEPGEIIVRWSGRNAEPIPDPLSKEIDFEGYRLYAARVNAPGQYSLVASWDIEDYKRFVYVPGITGTWKQAGNPRTIEAWKDLLGEDFDPRDYLTPSPTTCYKDTVLDDEGMRVERCSYWEPQDHNRGNVYEENGRMVENLIQRVADSVVFDPELGDTIRFGSYEARITNLNPALGWYVSLTAFDYGDVAINLDPLESAPGSCNEFAIPVYSAEKVDSLGLKVSVFPNPYKISYEGTDGRQTSYFREGYEAPQKRGSESFVEQDRRIWFTNLPQRATIRIYTLDGDLVRTIIHEDPAIQEENSEAFLSDYSSRAAWDLVTRNQQAVVSGIYIYHVDSPQGQQVGKLVIIK